MYVNVVVISKAREKGSDTMIFQLIRDITFWYLCSQLVLPYASLTGYLFTLHIFTTEM